VPSVSTGPRKRWRDRIFGAPRDPLAPGARHGIALMAVFAWIGLGADGLSSSAYGPAESYLALGPHSPLALYLALATALTVFIIALAYNQVIELFPSGGGGYKVATKLVGPYAGLVAGSALIVDYVLTISISIASGVEAIFSLFPSIAHVIRLEVQLALVALLVYLNLRGMKESIVILTPIFAGFVITHVAILAWGVLAHWNDLGATIAETATYTQEFASSAGPWAVALAFLTAYALGGGTYTGIEAVSNNVNTLKEPRVRTGKWTMFLMAVSLAVTAGGIILLYRLWDVPPVQTDRTLNAIAFQRVIASFTQDAGLAHLLLIVTLAFEGALLFVAANTGFLGGPAVLANLAADRWAPNQFSSLSSRLVAGNGVLLMGAAAILILLLTHGDVSLLVILYAVNVFLAFSLSLLGLTRHWWALRRDESVGWRLLLSATGFVITGGILIVTLGERFWPGGIAALGITAFVAFLGHLVRRHYDRVRTSARALEQRLQWPYRERVDDPPVLRRDAPTAVLLVSTNRGIGTYTVERVQQLFPRHFENFVLLCVGVVDTGAFGSDAALRDLQYETRGALTYLTNHLHRTGVPARWADAYGTDRVEALTRLCDETRAEFANSVFFAARLIFEREHWWNRWLHNQTVRDMERVLHDRGTELIVIPIRL
jgi:amino acid transporter